MMIASLAVPFIIAAVSAAGLFSGIDVFSAFTEGAKKGLGVSVRILPSLIALLTAVYMFRASGLAGFLTKLIAPALSFIGIPAETAPIMFIRPISGSGALAAVSEIISRYGADSLIGRTAAVMMGSTETTFYTISVYFGSLGIKDTKYAVPAALCADLAGFIAASFFTRLFFG